SRAPPALRSFPTRRSSDLPYWPLAAALGTVLAWNVFTLLVYVAAGGLACWWLRALGVGRGAALAGGLAFAIAPYRVEQSVGHLRSEEHTSELQSRSDLVCR